MGRLSAIGLAAAALALANGARAAPPEGPPPEILRGAVTKVSAQSLEIRTPGGALQTIGLSPDWNVQVTRPVGVDEIRRGSFIGTAEMPQKNGTGRSLEVHVFPPGVKVGEGHYGWSLKRGSMMTNGTVGEVVADGKGRAFDVTYPTGTRHIVVPPGVPIVQIVPGPRELVRPGARVFLIAQPAAGGLLASSVAVGENGAAPPM